MTYAKLENGVLQRAPSKIKSGKVTVYNPTDKHLMSLGYKPVTYTSMPQDAPDGYFYTYGWQEDAESITQTWTLMPNVSFV